MGQQQRDIERPPIGSGRYQPLLQRHVAMIALGGVVGAGLFVGSGATIHAAGPAVLASYAAAGALVYQVMRMLGEMALASPRTGTFNDHIGRALGRRAAVVSAWIYWYSWVIAVGVETIAGATILSGFVALPVWVLGIVVIAVMTGSNLLSVRSYGEVEYWLSLLKVGAIVAFIVIAAWLVGLSDPQGFGTAAVSLDGIAPNGWAAVIGTVPAALFSLTGSEIAAVAAAESDDPASNVVRAARSVTLRIALFYLGALTLILVAVPWTTVMPGQSPFLLVLDRTGLPGASLIMRSVILVAVLSCLNSGLYVTSRTLHELAATGAAPASFARRGRTGVPDRAILAGSVAGFAAALASMVSPGRVFAFLLDTSGALILFVYLLIALAQIQQGRYGLQSDATSPVRAWRGIVSSCAIVLVLTAMAAVPSLRSQLVASAGSVAIVALLVFSPLVRRWLGRRPAAIE